MKEQNQLAAEFYEDGFDDLAEAIKALIAKRLAARCKMDWEAWDDVIYHIGECLSEFRIDEGLALIGDKLLDPWAVPVTAADLLDTRPENVRKAFGVKP